MRKSKCCKAPIRERSGTCIGCGKYVINVEEEKERK